MTVEVHTTNTFVLCDQHNNHNTNASNDGGDVQGDNDYYEPHRGPKDVGLNSLPTTCMNRANH